MSLPVFSTYMSRLGFNYPTFRLCGGTLTHCATAAVENKQQTMKNDIETQHKNMHSWYIGSLCNSQIQHFTCIMVSQVLMNLWMKWSMSLNPAIFRDEQKRYLRVVLSFKFLSRPQRRKMLQCLACILHPDICSSYYRIQTLTHGYPN